MSSSSSTAPLPEAKAASFPASLVLLLATGAGLAVASIYFSQPLLGLLGESLQASTAHIGLVPTLTQCERRAETAINRSV